MCLFGIATSKEFEIQIEQATEGFQSSNYRNSSPRIWRRKDGSSYLEPYFNMAFKESG